MSCYYNSQYEITNDKAMNNTQNKIDYKKIIRLEKIKKSSINNKYNNSKKYSKQININKNMSNEKNISIKESYRNYNCNREVIYRNLTNIDLNNQNNFSTYKNKDENTNQIILNTNENNVNNGKNYNNNYYIEDIEDMHFNNKIYNNNSYFFNNKDKYNFIKNNNTNSQKILPKFNNNLKKKMDAQNNKKQLRQSAYLLANINNINFNNNEISIGNINIIKSEEDKNEIKKFLTRFNTNNDCLNNNSVNINQDIERKMSPKKVKKIQRTNIRKKILIIILIIIIKIVK